MRNPDHAAKFDDSNETSGSGESLSIDRRQCLFIGKLSGCKCGACGRTAEIQTRPTRCDNQSCNQEWSCIVVTPGAPEIPNPWLALYSESAITTNSRFSIEQRSKRYLERMGGSALDPDGPNLP